MFTYVYLPIFTNNIWSYLLWSPVIVEYYMLMLFSFSVSSGYSACATPRWKVPEGGSSMNSECKEALPPKANADRQPTQFIYKTWRVVVSYMIPSYQHMITWCIHTMWNTNNTHQACNSYRRQAINIPGILLFTVYARFLCTRLKITPLTLQGSLVCECQEQPT